jgi:hypothetical protein
MVQMSAVTLKNSAKNVKPDVKALVEADRSVDRHSQRRFVRSCDPACFERQATSTALSAARRIYNLKMSYNEWKYKGV